MYFPTIHWLTFGSKIDPKPANLPLWPCHRHHHQFLLTPHRKITAPLADPSRPWTDTINFCMVLTLCTYRFSARWGRLMVLCPDDMTPCLMAILSTWRMLHRGAIFTSSKHLSLSAQQRQKNIVWMHHFDLSSQWVWHRCHIGQCLYGGSKDDENQCNVSMMHRALNSLTA